MSKRVHPFRKTAPPALIQMLNNLPKYYLVGITGPTSFILQDLKNSKFKITIGSELKCSCSPKMLDHCAHTLFILSQVFSIQQKDPILWQTSYLNEELRYMIANRRIKLNKITEFLKYIRPSYLRTTHIIVEQQDQDQDDNLCAICQQQMVKTDPITSCNKMCKNSFHLQCFKQWGDYQLKTNSRVTCPLCRDQKSEEFMRQLTIQHTQHRQQQLNKKIGLSYSYYCEGCNLKEIEEDKDIYKCLICQDIILCQTCFKAEKHRAHSFIVKKQGNKKWTYTEDRLCKKKEDEKNKQVRIKLTQPRFYNFLANAIPCYFSKRTRQNILSCQYLDLKIEQLECIMCDDKQRAFLRRLCCGHFIHHKCLKRRIQRHKLFCKIDGQKFLLGYAALIKNEKLNKIIEKIDYQEDLKEELEEENNEDNKLKTDKSESIEKSASMSKTRLRNLSINAKRRSNRSLNKSLNPQ